MRDASSGGWERSDSFRSSSSAADNPRPFPRAPIRWPCNDRQRPAEARLADLNVPSGNAGIIEVFLRAANVGGRRVKPLKISRQRGGCLASHIWRQLPKRISQRDKLRRGPHVIHHRHAPRTIDQKDDRAALLPLPAGASRLVSTRMRQGRRWPSRALRLREAIHSTMRPGDDIKLPSGKAGMMRRPKGNYGRRSSAASGQYCGAAAQKTCARMEEKGRREHMRQLLQLHSLRPICYPVWTRKWHRFCKSPCPDCKNAALRVRQGGPYGSAFSEQNYFVNIFTPRNRQ